MPRRTWLRVVLAGLFGLIFSIQKRTAAARCAMSYWYPRVLSSGAIPLDGSIVVGLSSMRELAGDFMVTPQGMRLQQGEPPTGLTIQREGVTIALRVERLAPGLFRCTPERAPTPGEWSLRGFSLPFSVTFGSNPTSAPTAPSVQSVSLTTTQVQLGPGAIQTRQEVLLGLRTPPPTGVVAVIVRGANATTSNFYAPVGAGAGLLMMVYQTLGRCALDLPGVLPPAAGPVSLTWVDGSGRVSPATAAVLR